MSLDQAQAVAAPAPPQLVPPTVSEGKLNAELESWRANADTYRRRGWLLLNVNHLSVDIGFVAHVAVGEMRTPIITAAIRLNYDNYDLWPPSLKFIDPCTGAPALPVVQAPDQVHGEIRNVLLGQPGTGQPFLCLPGLREYHHHPQHTGDDWLLHRAAGEGTLAVICDRVWRRMARNVIGLTVQMQSLPQAGTQLHVGFGQGDVDAMTPTAPDGTAA